LDFVRRIFFDVAGGVSLRLQPWVVTKASVKLKLRSTFKVKALPRSMFISSIRALALAFLCLVGLSMIHMVDAACGGTGQANFNAIGTNFQQGEYGELYSAVRCILNGQNCATNVNGLEVYPPEAKGATGSDTSKLTAYYGANISNWCVGLVKDFSLIFRFEVSNKSREGV
jgi:hypothetical protein